MPLPSIYLMVCLCLPGLACRPHRLQIRPTHLRGDQPLAVASSVCVHHMTRLCCEVSDCSWQRRAAEERHAPNSAEYRRQQAKAWEAEKVEAQLNKVLPGYSIVSLMAPLVCRALPRGRAAMVGCTSASCSSRDLGTSRTVWVQARFERIRQRTKQARAIRQAAVLRGAWQVPILLLPSLPKHCITEICKSCTFPSCSWQCCCFAIAFPFSRKLTSALCLRLNFRCRNPVTRYRCSGMSCVLAGVADSDWFSVGRRFCCSCSSCGRHWPGNLLGTYFSFW